MNGCKTIAICNQKGGVGKTTTALNLGVGLAKAGRRVLLIDADPQSDLTSSLGWEGDKLDDSLGSLMYQVTRDSEPAVRQAILHHEEGVDLIPSNLDLSMMETQLVNAMSREKVLSTVLKDVKTDYDYILIDCMPSLGMITVNALTAADSVIIPVQAQYLPAKGMTQLMKSINMVRSHTNENLKVEGIVMTLVDGRTNLAKDVIDTIRTNYGMQIRIFDAQIPVAVKAAEAAKEGKSVAEQIRRRQLMIQKTGRRSARRAEQMIRSTFRALKAAIESTKALASAIAAGGWIAIIVILICVLFGAAFYVFGDDSSANYTSVSAEVEAYTPVIQKYASEYGISEYVELVKAVMMQESGGRGTDPMQCSESPYNKRYSHAPGSIKDPEYSIRCGIQYLADCLKQARCKSPVDMSNIRLALQGYNYGNGYIPWAIKRDGGYTVENAALFSDMQAKKHGWSGYGDKQYPAHVLRYYPYGSYNIGVGNTAIVKVAQQQIGNHGGRKFWSWYGFGSRESWCGCFVSWCADQCGYIKSGTIPKFSYVPSIVDWAKSHHQWQKRNYKPAPGDIIVIDWYANGTRDHVGIVESCDGKTVHTIEGNRTDQVGRGTYAVGSGTIFGYFVPRF